MFPHIPTIAESGVAGYEAASYYGVLAPASVPREIVERLNTILTTSLQASETRRSLESDGSLILASTPAEMSRLIQIETEKWSKIIKAAGIKPE
jgi:tripartite-type tricarboxylate transporter receptor subunit TctC